jgi:hypothetical protein
MVDVLFPWLGKLSKEQKKALGNLGLSQLVVISINTIPKASENKFLLFIRPQNPLLSGKVSVKFFVFCKDYSPLSLIYLMAKAFV